MQNSHLSIWPILTSFAVFILLLGVVFAIYNNLYILYIGIILFIACIYYWIQEINNEALQKNNQYNLSIETYQIKNSFNNKNFTILKLAINFFLVTELILVLSIIVAHLYIKYFANITTINSNQFLVSKQLDIWDIPFINTLILLLSSCFLTWSHNNLLKMLNNNNKQNSYLYKYSYSYKRLNNLQAQKYFKIGILLTAILGVIFLIFQYLEYNFLNFKMQDNVNFSIFYLITGFHGAHVFIGIIFLLICYFKNLNNAKILKRNDFILTSIYWHFVDFIWILVFIFFYLLN
ncbi:MAG: cytochrome c oxidase subunit 3 [Rickettsiales bacterium]